MHINCSVIKKKRKEKKKFNFEQKNYFVLLNEDIKMLLKLKKRFHKYLIASCSIQS